MRELQESHFRVPPHTVRVKQSVAWTLDMAESGYTPDVES
jgi:hypothetical protein